MAFAENTLFKSSGIICWSRLPFSLPGELSMDRGDNNDFFLARLVCRSSQSMLRPPEVHICTVYFNINVRFVWCLWGLMICMPRTWC